MADVALGEEPGCALVTGPQQQRQLAPECRRVLIHNATPDSLAELRAQARASFVRLGHRHDVLATFILHASLRLTGLP